MNRIIVIGNGFDMAHNLKTGYRDFINSYWDRFMEAIACNYVQHHMKTHGTFPLPDGYADEFVLIHVQNTKTDNILSRKIDVVLLKNVANSLMSIIIGIINV